MNYLTLAQRYFKQRFVNFIVLKHVEWTCEIWALPNHNIRGFAKFYKFHYSLLMILSTCLLLGGLPWNLEKKLHWKVNLPVVTEFFKRVHKTERVYICAYCSRVKGASVQGVIIYFEAKDKKQNKRAGKFVVSKLFASSNFKHFLVYL